MGDQHWDSQVGQRDPRAWRDHGAGILGLGTGHPELGGTETPGPGPGPGPGSGGSRGPAGAQAAACPLLGDGRRRKGRGGGCTPPLPSGTARPFCACAPRLRHLPTSLCAPAAKMAALRGGGALWRRGEGLLTGVGCLCGARPGAGGDAGRWPSGGGRACDSACPYPLLRGPGGLAPALSAAFVPPSLQAGCPPCSSSATARRRSPGTGRPCTSSARS